METASHTVLLVEDDPDVRLAMADLLEDEGYRCIVAGDGVDALDVLGRQTPSLIMADLLMPRMNGIELLDRLRRDRRLRHIPTIVMTAASERIAGMRLEDLNAPILHKPIDADIMRQMLAARCPLPPNGGGTAEARARQLTK